MGVGPKVRVYLTEPPGSAEAHTRNKTNLAFLLSISTSNMEKIRGRRVIIYRDPDGSRQAHRDSERFGDRRW